MNITTETKSYNEKRYGRPWIAKVDFSESAKGEFSWGDWIGDHYNGGAGMLSITANPGDIIAQGQKDTRQPRNSAPDFFVVAADGTLDAIGDKGAAYKHFLENKDKAPDYVSLREERETLLVRVAEINNILEGEQK